MQDIRTVILDPEVLGNRAPLCDPEENKLNTALFGRFIECLTY
jgi:hypothetical protein